MRMRKKHRLEERTEACERVMVRDAEKMRGKWLEGTQYADLYLELGCGKGLFTIGLADANPEALIAAIEREPNALLTAMERASVREHDNIRYLSMDAKRIGEIFLPGEVSKIFINFSDPWPKYRDADRRLTSPGFLKLYGGLLQDGGEILFKTDNIPLFEYSLEQMEKAGYELCEVTNDLHENGICGVLSDYETRFLKDGIKINRCVAKKRSV